MDTGRNIKLKTIESSEATVEYSDTDKLATEILNGVAENLKRKRDLNNAIHTIMWKPNQDKKTRTQIHRVEEDLNKMSWADISETTDDEGDKLFNGDMKGVNITDEATAELREEDKTE